MQEQWLGAYLGKMGKTILCVCVCVCACVKITIIIVDRAIRCNLNPNTFIVMS